MEKFIFGFYGVQILFLIICLFLGYFIYDKRFNRNHGNQIPERFQRTSEVNIDPVTGEKTRVYYNPDTGERFYKKEK
ncbi:hypothetical protein [Bacillus sp. AFS096315]|uniref:hypothetical protein n=1 Tax=Bacillus sp. AFS096315 TaxID=2033517 RepID=UPI000BECAD06|nr:hypothetical protein [Bacillus sp. AFS096315]PEC48659.1 hypothetical protein CON00_13820 [Bacillus sp. AFS096315]